jgi:WhiB family transcriptional regulator, redox-sensing transcriptional regulator
MRSPVVSYADPAGWATRGACQDCDPELFFPVTSRGPARRQVAKAKAICVRCPVQPQCLEFALETGQSFGIWGGATEDERRALRRSVLRRRRRLAARRRPDAAPHEGDRIGRIKYVANAVSGKPDGEVETRSWRYLTRGRGGGLIAGDEPPARPAG